MSTSALDPTAAETEKQKRSKWRLSNPFKDKDSNLSAQTSDAQLRDSAYGSSETTDTSPAVSSQTIPTITQDQADAQGAHTETKTDARGRVVTTTTTTVITTTTKTTEGEHYDIPAGKQVVVTNEERTTSGPTELGGDPVTREELEPPPTIPSKHRMRSRSPQVPLLGGKRSAEPVSPHHQNISQNSQLEPISPTSPQAQNFSRPGRQLNPSSDPESHGERPNLYNQASMNTSRVMDPSQGYQQPQRYYQQASHPSSLTPGHQGQQPVHNSYSTPHQPSLSGQSSESLGGNGSGYPPRLSTAQSIRTAAAGIHGAGETLRGALNSKVARHTGATPEEIAAHDAVVERGRREIETGKFASLASVPEVQTPPVSVSDHGTNEKPKKSMFGKLRKEKSKERGF